MNAPDDRSTWKDYLRVALPAIGLVLIAALFIFWASELFEDDTSGPTETASPVAAIATVPPPTPTATVEVSLDATEESGGSTDNSGTPSNGSQPDEVECDSDLGKADKVVVTEEEVRMRSEPDTTQDNVVETLSAGTELVIVGDCFVEDDEGNAFWQVRNDQTSSTGYVSADFVAPPSDEEE